MAKFEGKQGRWITTKTGKHVFVEQGKSVKEALADAFEEYTYDNEKKYARQSWGGTNIFDTEEEREKAYNHYMSKDYDFDLDYNKVFELFNNPDLSEMQIKRELGDLFGIYSKSNNWELGATLFNKYFKEDYEQVIKERELKEFAPRIKAAEEYLSTMPKLENADTEIINSGANYHNYREAKKVYKYSFDDTGEYNPEKAKKLYDNYTSNCQRCVMAWFLRNQGYDVQALEWDGEITSGNYNWEKNPSNYILNKNAPTLKRDDGFMKKNWSFTGFNIPKNSAFDYNGKNKQWASTQFKEISKMVEDAGPGAVYFCSVYWRGHNSSHVFVIHNNNGKARFIDPQNNSDASQYFDKNKYALITESTTVKRVDNLTLNGDMLKYIVKKYEKKPSMEDKIWKGI